MPEYEAAVFPNFETSGAMRMAVKLMSGLDGCFVVLAIHVVRAAHVVAVVVEKYAV